VIPIPRSRAARIGATQLPIAIMATRYGYYARHLETHTPGLAIGFKEAA